MPGRARVTIAGIAAACGLAAAVHAQDDCATVIGPADVRALEALHQSGLYSVPPPAIDGPVYVGLTFHVVRTSAGTGGLPQSRLDQAVIDANDMYAPAGIQFCQSGPTLYLNSDTYYNIDNTSEANALRQINPVAGTISFSVGAASTPPSAAEDDVQADPVVRALIPVGKYLGYAGLVLLVGPVLVLALLWPQRLDRRGPGRLIWTGIGLVAGSTVLGLWLQAPYTLGTGLFDVGLGDLRDVLGSTFGAVMLVRLGVVIAAAFLLRPLLTGPS